MVPRVSIFHFFLIFRDIVVIQGSIRDRDSLGKVLKEYEIEVVISAVGGGCILDQLVLVDAIKGAGTVKVFQIFSPIIFLHCTHVVASFISNYFYLFISSASNYCGAY